MRLVLFILVLLPSLASADDVLARLNRRHCQAIYERELRWLEDEERGIVAELEKAPVWVGAWGELQEPALRVLERCGRIRRVGDKWTLVNPTPVAPVPPPNFTDRSGFSILDGMQPPIFLPRR